MIGSTAHGTKLPKISIPKRFGSIPNMFGSQRATVWSNSREKTIYFARDGPGFSQKSKCQFALAPVWNRRGYAFACVLIGLALGLASVEEDFKEPKAAPNQPRGPLGNPKHQAGFPTCLIQAGRKLTLCLIFRVFSHKSEQGSVNKRAKSE